MSTKYNILSEELEPTFALIIGRLFARCESVKDSEDYADKWIACSKLWFVVTSMSFLSTICETTHATITLQNNKRFISNYIEEMIEVDPFKEFKRGL